MKTLVVFGAIAATLLAASIATDNSGVNQQTEFAQIAQDSIEIPVVPPEVLVESAGTVYEYPSVEDASILRDTPEDSLVHYILFQEKPSGDVYSIK